LASAIGTNDITRYFPFYEATNQLSPTTFILTQLQREAAGKIKLGIDLQGGTSFLVRMGTNELADTTPEDSGTNAPGSTTNQVSRPIDTGAALAQAIGSAAGLCRSRVSEQKTTATPKHLEFYNRIA